MKITVLMGGASAERNVSLASGIRIVNALRSRGHEVQPFIVGTAANALDFHVDFPPYKLNPHLRLKLAGFVSTSAGLVVRRGV